MSLEPERRLGAQELLCATRHGWTTAEHLTGTARQSMVPDALFWLLHVHKHILAHTHAQAFTES